MDSFHGNGKQAFYRTYRESCRTQGFGVPMVLSCDPTVTCCTILRYDISNAGHDILASYLACLFQM